MSTPETLPNIKQHAAPRITIRVKSRPKRARYLYGTNTIQSLLRKTKRNRCMEFKHVMPHTEQQAWRQEAHRLRCGVLIRTDGKTWTKIWKTRLGHNLTNRIGQP